MSRALLAISMASLLGGCATAITSGTSTVDLLDLNASRGDGLAYALLDGSRQPIARAVSHDGRIRFDLPADLPIGRCVVVLDDTGHSALGERSAIHLALRAEFQELRAQRERIAVDEAALEAASASRRRDADATRSRLQVNPALVDGTCRRPAAQPAPPPPATSCASRQDCLRDGAALCFTQQYGASGCQRAAKELGLSGLGSNPLCKPAAAARASGGIDSAIFGALKNAAADVARTLQGSTDSAEKALGGMVANASDLAQISNARDCTNAYVERALAPQAAWNTRLRQLREEPQRQLEACQAGADALRDADQQATATAAQSRELAEQAHLLEGRLESLRRERRAIEWCDSEKVAGRG